MCKPPKRPCPRCGGAVHITNTVTPINTPAKVERLQSLTCSQCGLKGTLTTKELITWTYPDQV